MNPRAISIATIAVVIQSQPMCFSATASFTAAALLVPLGLYASKLALDGNLKYLSFALIPFGFGIQQGLEGIEWLAIHHDHAEVVRLAALGFLAFSHGIWLIWLPLTVLCVEQRPWAKKLLMVVVLLGALFGASLYGPFLFSSEMFSVTVVQGSIDYQTNLIYDPFLPRDVLRLLYVLIVLGPLWLSELVQFRTVGGFLAVAFMVTYGFYNYAFVSVWCFFAAILSGYIVYVLQAVVADSIIEKT